MEPQPLKVLVCPLDWGLGHASRCIPVIRLLLAEGFEVITAGHGRSLALLRQEFPLLRHVVLKGFSPSYSRSGNMVWHMMLRVPSFLYHIVAEHYKIRKIAAEHSIDIIISDNRYGLWSRKHKSILITHQVMIKAPKPLQWTEPILYRISRLLISRFHEYWIPDFETAPGLSGDLSHRCRLPENAVFVNPLSRFSAENSGSDDSDDLFRIVAVLSGPEPQRSLFEAMLRKQLAETGEKAVIIGGKTDEQAHSEVTGSLTVLSSANSEALQRLISGAELVICRAGYSSIMDLCALGAKALLVPTPGQTEQEYLALLHASANRALSRSQQDLDLRRDIPEALACSGFAAGYNMQPLLDAVRLLKKK